MTGARPLAVEAAHLLSALEPCMWITQAGLRGFLKRMQAFAALPLHAAADGGARLRPVAVGSDGTAHIPIRGEIVPHAMRWEEELGVVSVETIRAQFRQALADASVTAIRFDVDSYGGFVSGVPDLADEIMAARGKKRMLAVADDAAFSAAYYLAAAADRIVLSRTAGVGSIGVISVHVDESALLERMGVKLTAVKAGEKKDQFAWWAPLSDDAKAELQAQVDRSMDLFAGFVATARGLEEGTVRAFEAGLFYGEKAVKAGLADRVVVPAEAARELRRIGSNGQRAGAEDEPAQEDEGMADKDDKAPVIDLAAERAKWEGEQVAKAEVRVKGIKDVFAGFTAKADARPDLVALQAECIADLTCTPERASQKLLATLANSDPHISGAHAGGNDPADQPTRITAADTARFFQKRREAAAKAGVGAREQALR